MSTILHYDIINKTSERLPTVKPKHLFCPFQVSGSEGICSISSKGWQWTEAAALCSRELTSLRTCPGLITPRFPLEQQDGTSSSRRLRMSSRILVHHWGYPDCLHQWRSSTTIPAGRRTIRLEQTVSTPVIAYSTRLRNFHILLILFPLFVVIVKLLSTVIHLHLMSLIDSVPNQ